VTRLTDYLPAAVRALADLPSDGRLAGEPRADCARCPMVAAPERPWSFDPATRCCTFHPSIANFLVGRLLACGGRAAELVRARLDDPDGLSAWGIRPPAAARAALGEDGFGRDRGRRCPFYTAGELTCGIWAGRPATCRTWFCRHDDGLRGGQRWSAVDRLLSQIESRVARLVANGRDPGADWAAFYADCADRADRLTAAELAPIAAAVAPLAGEVARLVDAPAPPPARHLRPAVSRVVELGDRLALFGYSPFDPVVTTRAAYRLLAALDGDTDRETALARSGASAELLDELVRIGAVEAADEPTGR
jgi:hypothetical protein